MDLLLPIAAFVFVAALTPGPNNIVVMRAAAHSGLVGSLSAIGGIVLGSLALLSVTLAGAGAVFALEPRLQSAVRLVGCAYLAWLGLGLIRAHTGSQQARDRTGFATHGASALSLFGFQFLNPKAWIMVLTASAAMPSELGAIGAFARLGAIFTLIPALCLLAWSLLGTALTRHLEHGPRRVWFDRAMGSLLVISAILLGSEI